MFSLLQNVCSRIFVASGQFARLNLLTKYVFCIGQSHIRSSNFEHICSEKNICSSFGGSVDKILPSFLKYTGFPKLIGECGGKNYHFVHTSADVESVVNGTVRSAFEYQGQKCSACSRMHVPESLWPQLSLIMSYVLFNTRLQNFKIHVMIVIFHGQSRTIFGIDCLQKK